MSDDYEDETRAIQLEDNTRVETGPVRFVHEDGYEDWSGTFIRGDNSAYYAMNLRMLIDKLKSKPELLEEDPEIGFAISIPLKSLLSSLEGSRE